MPYLFGSGIGSRLLVQEEAGWDSSPFLLLKIQIRDAVVTGQCGEKPAHYLLWPAEAGPQWS